MDSLFGKKIVALKEYRPVDNLKIEISLRIGPKRILREASSLPHPVEPDAKASVVVYAVSANRHPHRHMYLDSRHLVSGELFIPVAARDVAVLDRRPDCAETAADAGLSAI